MSSGNKKKAEQLGMPHGTAANRLRKLLLFDLAVKSGLGTCFRCDEPIESAKDLSIEHKVPWLDTEDPVGLFFDLNNIAFSHLSCNIVTRRISGFEADPRKMVYLETKNLQKPWRARGRLGDKMVCLGYYATREEAVQARKDYLEVWRK